MSATVLVGDCRAVLRTMDAESVQCCVTSPPYWGLRDYGVDGQMGLEPTPELYVEHLVDVMREVWRVLRPDGTLWLNLGDSYAGSGRGLMGDGTPSDRGDAKQGTNRGTTVGAFGKSTSGLKPKDLVGIPWRVAFALQADGWWLRSDIIWHKPNPMPESVTDRPTKAHEYVFLLTKSARYFYDAEAIKEACSPDMERRAAAGHTRGRGTKLDDSRNDLDTLRSEAMKVIDASTGRNARSVWSITTKPFRGAHFATMPVDLAERCILAGTSAKGCCPKCGAPWERVVEREKIGGVYMVGAKAEGNYGGQGRAGSTLGSTLPHNERAPKTTTLGWQPPCDCDAGEPVPCVVLDPFGGAGTTALAAVTHRRNAVIIELNEDYAELARERTAEVQPRLGVLA